MEDKIYKAICKKCGGDVYGIDVIEHHHSTIYEDGYFINIVAEEVRTGESYYQCYECKTKTKTFRSADIELLKNIANLVVDDEK